MNNIYPIPKVVVSTNAMRKIETALRMCSKAENWASMVVLGPKGCGKSTALRILSQRSGYFYVEANSAKKRTNDILGAILAENGTNRNPQYTNQRANEVTRVLRTETDFDDQAVKKVLVVDEMQQLEWSAILTLMQIAEIAGCILILAGNERSLISGRDRPKEALEPIASRIFLSLKLDPFIPEDFEQLASAYGVEGMATFKMCVAFGIRTDLRQLGFLLTTAKEIAAGKPIQKLHLEGAAIIRHGKEDGMRMLSMPDQKHQLNNSPNSSDFSKLLEMRC